MISDTTLSWHALLSCVFLGCGASLAMLFAVCLVDTHTSAVCVESWVEAHGEACKGSGPVDGVTL